LKAESFPHSKILKTTQLTEISTNNSISLKVSRNSILFFTHIYDRLYILYINFPQVFLRIAKMRKKITATIVAKLVSSFKYNGVFKQMEYFFSIPTRFCKGVKRWDNQGYPASPNKNLSARPL